ncbi:MAG: hypothetical protein F9K40_05730 [Kofleriaceae bacterium]|nr:MAG: hypothetical protein F9K40_05730 [Kofleriaceae bacterium]MBZ0232073.1 hypothetical protein [Kofleriaceae bacterium]
MQFRTIKKALVAAAAVFGLAFAAPGCATHGRGALYVTNAQPPPPRYVDAPYRPGYTYIQGRWEHYDNGWTWRDGYYVRQRPDQVYIQGRWYSDGNRWRWRDGYWDRRDHRTPYRRSRHVNDYPPR